MIILIFHCIAVKQFQIALIYVAHCKAKYIYIYIWTFTTYQHTCASKSDNIRMLPRQKKSSCCTRCGRQRRENTHKYKNIGGASVLSSHSSQRHQYRASHAKIDFKNDGHTIISCKSSQKIQTNVQCLKFIGQLCFTFYEHHLFGCCERREHQRLLCFCICGCSLFSTARTAHRGSFSFVGATFLCCRTQTDMCDLNPNQNQQ